MDRELQMRVTALEHALRILLEELDAKGTLARTTMLRRLEEFEQSSGSLSMNWLPLPGGCAKALVTLDGCKSVATICPAFHDGRIRTRMTLATD